MSLLPDYYLLRGGAGGGIKIVSELPDPVQGKQPLIVYVERDYYESGGTHTAAQTTFTVTPAALGGDSIGGAPMPALTYVSNIFQDNNRHIYVQMTNLLVPLAEAARPNGLGVSVEVDAAAGVALGDFGSTRLQTGPSATRWVVGTDVAVRFRRGDGRYLAADGEFYEVRPDDDPLIKENFYHVSPETGLWVEGLGLAEGGLPGAVLHEAGLSDADVRNHDWRGVLVGLSREDSGGDWRMATVPGRDAVQASVRISAAGSSSLLVTLGPVTGGHAAAGAEGNNWRIRVTDAGGNAVTASNQAAGTILVGIPAAGATLIQVRDAINVITGVDATSFGGGTAFPRVNGAPTDEYVFAGGLDAEEMGVAYDEATKIVTLTHLSGHTQQEIVEFLDANELDADTTLYAILLGGSDPAAMIDDAPLSRPFVNIFSRGSLPRPSSDEIDARVQALVRPYALDGGPLISGTDADPAFVLEPEVTQAFLLGIIGLTQDELNNLFVDARVQGTGAARSVVIDQQDGSTVTLALGDTTGGTGGSGGADGVLSGVEFAADGSTFTASVAEADGTTTTYTVNIPAALRQAGLSQPLVQNLITAYLQDYDTATEVAADIAQALTNYRRLATVVENSGDVTLTPGDRGSTLRHTGNAAATYTPAVADPPVGWWTRLLNTSTAVLTFDVGVTRRIEGAGQSVEIAAGDCVTVQFLGAATWAVVTDTAGAAAAGGGGGQPARELVVLEKPAQITAATGVTSQVLPAGYESYARYEIIVVTAEVVVSVLTGPTAWLFEQTDAQATRLGVMDNAEDGDEQWLTWTPSTRTLGRGAQTSPHARIQAVRLYDDGGGGGAAGEIPDNSITPEKLDDDTAEKRRLFRAALEAAHIGSGSALPAAALSNIGDVWIFPQDVLDGLAWRDISDIATEITSANAGDVGLYLLRSGWVRVGNILERSGRMALAAATGNSGRLDDVEALVTDIDRIVDGVSWQNAAVADAQFAYTRDLTSTAAIKLLTADINNPFDPAAQITAANFNTSGGAVLWSTARPVHNDSVVLVRVRKGEAGLQYRTRIGAEENILQGYRLRASDANWDYYFGGLNESGGNQDVAVQKRTEQFHTGFHGELFGRALEQVRNEIAPALARTQRIRPLGQWVSGGGAQTIRLEWKPVGAIANGAAVGVNIAGAAIAGVTTSEALTADDTNGTVLTIAVNAANAATIDRAASTIAGHVEVQITHGGIVDTTWMGVRKPTGFRRITTPGTPYTVRDDDEDFRIEIDHTGGEPINVDIAKVQLVPGTAKSFTFSESRPDVDHENARVAYVTVMLSANERQLAVAIAGNGAAGWSIAGVFAR